MLIFNHIPKTAGSTMRWVLWRQYPQGVFFSMKMGAHRERLAALRTRIARGDVPGAFVTHAGYGVHEHLPGAVDYAYVTFLREPIERVLSGYAMFRRQGRIPAGVGVAEFVRQFPRPGWNMQTAYLSGYFLECHLAGRDPEFERFDEALLERAKANLRRHAVVGLTEAFDRSLLLMRARLGWHWRGMFYARANVGHGRPGAEALDPEARYVVEAHNTLDIELYRYARQLFAEQLDEAGAGLERALAPYQRINAVAGAVLPRALPLARPIVHAARRLRGAAAPTSIQP